MKYSEYINWILENPANFNFVCHNTTPYKKDEDCIWNYKIYYNIPNTVHKIQVISFKVCRNSNVIKDAITGLEIANTSEINFRLLCKFVHEPFITFENKYEI